MNCLGEGLYELEIVMETFDIDNFKSLTQTSHINFSYAP